MGSSCARNRLTCLLACLLALRYTTLQYEGKGEARPIFLHTFFHGCVTKVLAGCAKGRQELRENHVAHSFER